MSQLHNAHTIMVWRAVSKPITAQHPPKADSCMPIAKAGVNVHFPIRSCVLCNRTSPETAVFNTAGNAIRCTLPSNCLAAAKVRGNTSIEHNWRQMAMELWTVWKGVCVHTVRVICIHCVTTWVLAHFGLSTVDSVIHNLSNSMNFCGKEWKSTSSPCCAFNLMSDKSEDANAYTTW